MCSINLDKMFIYLDGIKCYSFLLEEILFKVSSLKLFFIAPVTWYEFSNSIVVPFNKNHIVILSVDLHFIPKMDIEG